MSEVLEKAVAGFLAQGRSDHLTAVLESGADGIAVELYTGWLPRGWTTERDADGAFTGCIAPDTVDAAEGAAVDAERHDRAAATWMQLSDRERDAITAAVAVLRRASPSPSPDGR